MTSAAPAERARRGWVRWFPAPAERLPVLLSAALFAVAFPPFPFVVPVFLCLVPLGVAIARAADGEGRPLHAVRMGAWFCILSWAVNLYWIAVALSLYTKLAILGFVATLVGGSPLLGAAAAVVFVGRRHLRLPLALLLPVAWVSQELAFNYLSDLAFPWLPLGLATARVPLLAQLAELSGIRGVSFWIAAINGLLADAWLMRHQRRALSLRMAAVAGLLVGAAAFGWWRMNSIILHPVANVSVVQPNIPQHEKWQEDNRDSIVRILSAITREQHAEQRMDMVVWPEVALPGYLIQHPEWVDTIASLTSGSGVPLLFGALDVQFLGVEDYEYYNAAFFTDSTGNVRAYPPYRKSYLVPVVERVPFFNPRWFSGLRWFGGYGRGAAPEPFALPTGRFGVLICYESIFPQRSRHFRGRGADFLVNITNDAWFGRTLAPHQHLSHLAFRAIENRVGIARSANTGISGYIDPLGRFHHETELEVATRRAFTVQTTDVWTLYARVGDWIGVLSFAGAMALLALHYARRRRA